MGRKHQLKRKASANGYKAVMDNDEIMIPGTIYQTWLHDSSNLVSKRGRLIKEKLYQWILRQHEEGSRLTVADILAHIQNEVDYGGEDASASPRFQVPHQHSQSTMHSTNTSNQPPSGFSAQPTAGSAFRSSHSDQSKNSVFSNALSSPVRRSLQPYHLAQGGGSYYVNGGGRSNELNRESNSPSPNDSDMHSDSPPHESY